MQLSYIPDMPENKEDAIRIYEALSFRVKVGPIRDAIQRDKKIIRTFPEEAFTQESFGKFEAHTSKELLTKLNMRSLLASHTYYQGKITREELNWFQNELEPIMKDVISLLRQNVIEFPCEMDLVKTELSW